MNPPPKTDWKHMTNHEQRIVADLAVRYGLSKASEISGRHWATIRTACRALGLTPKVVKQNTPPAIRAKAVAYYRKHDVSFAKVGAKFGVSGARVYQWNLDAKREAA